MKGTSYHHIILCLLFFSYMSFGQENNKIDSLLNLIPVQKDSILVNTYYELFNAQVNKSPEIAKPYLDTAITKATVLNNSRLDAKLKLARGMYEYLTSKFNEAETTLKEALTLFSNLDDKKNISTVYNYLGVVQKYNGQLKEALESHMISLGIKEELKIGGVTLLGSYANIGVIHSLLENYDISNEYYAKAEAIAIEENLERDISLIRSNMAINFKKENKFDKALEYYLETMDYLEKKKEYRRLAKQYNSIGVLYIDLDSLKKAKNFLSKALTLSEEKGELQMVGLIYRNLGTLDFKAKKYNAALKNFQKALSISEETGTETRMIEDYLKIANAYAALGDYKNAYDYEKLHFKKYDTILKAENVKKMNELEIAYQTEKKEQQILLQENEITLLEEKEKVSNLQKMALTGGLVLSALALGFGFYGFRQKIKSNLIEKEKAEAELEFKKKELTTHALHLAKKSEVLAHIKEKAKELKSTENGDQAYHQLIKTINFDEQVDNNWENFTQYFEQVHKDFGLNINKKYTGITKNERRFMALMRMNLTSKEIATILNISADGVKKARQRLRKKMELSPKDSLEGTILSI